MPDPPSVSAGHLLAHNRRATLLSKVAVLFFRDVDLSESAELFRLDAVDGYQVGSTRTRAQEEQGWRRLGHTGKFGNLRLLGSRQLRERRTALVFVENHERVIARRVCEHPPHSLVE